MWLLLVACTQPFSCENAASSLGFEGAVVENCSTLERFPEIYQVALSGGSIVVGREVLGVHVVDGKVQTAYGDAALADFLDGLGSRRDDLTLSDLLVLFRTFRAFPEGIDAKVGMFDIPHIGRSTLSVAPFRADLYNGRAPEPGFIHVSLTGPPWTWTRREQSEDGMWRELGSHSLP